MNRPQVTARGLAAAAVVALVVTACDSGSEATPTPEPTQAATSTPAVTAAPTAAPSLPTPEPTAGPSVVAAADPSDALPVSALANVDPRPAPELVDLVSADGSAFDIADYGGTSTLLFFGYTHCPDVCPQTIGEIIAVFDEVPGADAVFISVDPERDTPEFLTEWTEYLPENLHAVTGSPGAIRRAADNYGVKYARVETSSTTGYSMSHTADLYLIDKDGQLLLAYPFGTPAAEIVRDLRVLDAG